jgi:YegS/Rv2252/BmrU family lipid kinase
VIAGGGDGTFSAIARYFVNSQSVLGVLPLGTGNAFARDLGIPAQLETACEIVVNGKDAGVDLGYAGNDYFLNVATIGLTTKIAQALTVPMKRKWGRFVYAIAISQALRKVMPFQVRIETENGVDEFETLQLVLGNGRYHAGPFPLSPDASITEGKLTLYALATANKAAFLRLAMNLPTGRHVDLPEVHCQDTVGGTIITVPPMPVTVDGEVCMHTPMPFSVAPDAIRVRAPRSFEG